MFATIKNHALWVIFFTQPVIDAFQGFYLMLFSYMVVYTVLDSSPLLLSMFVTSFLFGAGNLGIVDAVSVF